MFVLWRLSCKCRPTPEKTQQFKRKRETGKDFVYSTGCTSVDEQRIPSAAAPDGPPPSSSRCCCCCCQASECQDQRQKKEERSKACHIVSFSATADRVWLRDDYRQSLRSAPMPMRQEISDIFQRRDGSDGEREMRRDVQESGRREALHHN